MFLENLVEKLCSVFSLLLLFSIQLVLLCVQFQKIRWETAWCNGCPADQITDNWTYVDLTRSTTSPHAAMVNRAFNRAMQSSTNNKKSGSLGKQKVIRFHISRKNEYFSKKKKPALMASMAFAETETKVTKTLLPFVHHNVKVSWQRRDTSNNIDAITLESSKCPRPLRNWALPGRTLSKVHDGVGHAKPPQLGVGNPPPRPSLPVCRSNPHAIKSGRFT